MRINIPLAYPGIAAGLALVLMEVLADFGTVALLRYPTFTEAIYRQMTARFDPQGAAALSTFLLGMTLLILVGERYFRGQGRFDQTKGSCRPYVPRRLGHSGGLMVSLYLGFLLTLAFLAPTTVLAIWAVGQLVSGTADPRIIGFGLNSLFTAAAGATLAVLLALPVAYLHARFPGIFHRFLFRLSTLGYSLPGPVIAVGLLLTLPVFFPWLYGGISLLLLAYVIRFIPIALQSQDSSLAAVSRSLEEASRTLGAGVWKTITRITLPLIKPGLITGWVVVFADCMKELPATLMLRPLGFDTLSVRVWMEASEAFWDMAALPALMIVIAGILPIAYLIRLGTRKGVKAIDIT
jgi:iron(III) transport system permease protein